MTYIKHVLSIRDPQVKIIKAGHLHPEDRIFIFDRFHVITVVKLCAPAADSVLVSYMDVDVEVTSRFFCDEMVAVIRGK